MIEKVSNHLQEKNSTPRTREKRGAFSLSKSAEKSLKCLWKKCWKMAFICVNFVSTKTAKEKMTRACQLTHANAYPALLKDWTVKIRTHVQKWHNLRSVNWRVLTLVQRSLKNMNGQDLDTCPMKPITQIQQQTPGNARMLPIQCLNQKCEFHANANALS